MPSVSPSAASPSSDAPYPEDAWEPVSLGYTCATKFQISRRMYFAKYPNGDLHEFRRSVLTPSYGSANYDRHVFDWSTTQFNGVIRALQAGFEGCFERAEFTVKDGEAYHTRLLSAHPHDFHPSDPAVGLTEGDITAQFPAARSKFEHLARRFVTLREQPGRYLYVTASLPYVGHVEQLMEWLGAGSPLHDFKVLLVGAPYEEDQPYDRLGDRLVWTRIPAEVRKAAQFQWEGDDGHWDEALAPYRLWPHRERMVRCIDEPDAG